MEFSVGLHNDAYIYMYIYIWIDVDLKSDVKFYLAVVIASEDVENNIGRVSHSNFSELSMSAQKMEIHIKINTGAQNINDLPLLQ